MKCEVRLLLEDIYKKRKKAKKAELGAIDLYLKRKAKKKPAKSKTKKPKAPKKKATEAKKKAAKPLMEISDDGGLASFSDRESMYESSLAESSFNIRTNRTTRRRNITRSGLLLRKSESYPSDTDGETVEDTARQDKKVNRRIKKRSNQDDIRLRHNAKVIVSYLDKCYNSSEPNAWCDINEDSSLRQQNTTNSVQTVSMDILPSVSAKKPARSKKKKNSTAGYPPDEHSIQMDHSETGIPQSANTVESYPEVDLSARTAECHNTTSNVSCHNNVYVRLRRLSPIPIYNHVDITSEQTASINRVAETTPVTADTLIESLLIPLIPAPEREPTIIKPIKKRKLTTTKYPKVTKRRKTLSMITSQSATENEPTVATPPTPLRIRVRTLKELQQQPITQDSQANTISAVPIRTLMPYELNREFACKVVLEDLARHHALAAEKNPIESPTRLDESSFEPEIRNTIHFSPNFTNRAIEQMDVSDNTIVNDVDTQASSASNCTFLYQTAPHIDEDAENDAEIAQINDNRNHDYDSDHFFNQYESDSVTSGMNTNPPSSPQSPLSPFAFDSGVVPLVATDVVPVVATDVYPSSIEPSQNLIDIAIVPPQEPSIGGELSLPTSSICMNNGTISSTITDASSPINSDDSLNSGQNLTSNVNIQQPSPTAHGILVQDPIAEAATESASIQLNNGDDSTENLEILDDIVSPEYEEHVSPKSPVVAARKGTKSRILRRRDTCHTSFIPLLIPQKLASNVSTSGNMTHLKPKAIAAVSEQRVTSSQEDLIAISNCQLSKSIDRCEHSDRMISSTNDTQACRKYQGIGQRRSTTLGIVYAVQGKPNRK